MRDNVLKKINSSKNRFVQLAQMNIGDNEIAEIMEKIKEACPEITELDLDSNDISDAGAKTLKEYLNNFEIKTLSIQHNKIGRDGALALFSHSAELEILFHGNKITNVTEMEDLKHQAQSGSFSLR